MFEDLGLHESLVRSVAACGFSTPTPVQLAAVPPAAAGRDVLASAPTGTGKTAAFVLPLLQRLREGKPRRNARALILTPTRELAGQVEEQLRRLATRSGLRGAIIVGGVAMGPQVRTLRTGVDVIVATPGRLLDHLQQGNVRLGDVEILVLDEADRMLDMGFLPAIRQVLAEVPEERQTLLFSATLPRPIVELARTLLRDPVRVDLQPKTSPAAGIRQAIYPVAHDDKAGLLLHLLGGDAVASALVFTRTKHRANRLARTLELRGVPCAAIHGNRTQAQRNQALSGFRTGRFRVLVATDVASRGIDVEKLSHVVNFDIPQSAEDYVHRIGRTARAQATGDAWTFVSSVEERDWRDIERVLGRRVDRLKADGFEPATLAAEPDLDDRPDTSYGDAPPARHGERPRNFQPSRHAPPARYGQPSRQAPRPQHAQPSRYEQPRHEAQPSHHGQPSRDGQYGRHVRSAHQPASPYAARAAHAPRVQGHGAHGPAPHGPAAHGAGPRTAQPNGQRFRPRVNARPARARS
jgi:ATP-dependent RNA helicase RhlE